MRKWSYSCIPVNFMKLKTTILKLKASEAKCLSSLKRVMWFSTRMIHHLINKGRRPRLKVKEKETIRKNFQRFILRVIQSLKRHPTRSQEILMQLWKPLSSWKIKMLKSYVKRKNKQLKRKLKTKFLMHIKTQLMETSICK